MPYYRRPADKRADEHAQAVADSKKPAKQAIKTWTVVYNFTRTVVEADSMIDAFDRWIQAKYPSGGNGRIMPPPRNEVVVRAATEADLVDAHKRRPRVDLLSQHGGEMFPESPRINRETAVRRGKGAPVDAEQTRIHQSQQERAATVGSITPDPALEAALADPGAAVRAARPGKARRDAPATARAAATNVTPRTGTQRWRILELLARHTLGLTDGEMQHLLAIKGDSQRPRRVELAEGGWVEETGEVRDAATGERANVWAATEKGLALFHDAGARHATD